ncbi:AppB [Paenibacillus mucilaginosus 3016]|uniref:AppB n=1 Tax=Paenibacillus mucilaginosus 3016 TaxID=1116391 RepID=H6NKC0_9BACL|nr:ABC transporter permease [Paenibacillus mucilaginosus]AFC31604.1 AppB [Paenibacillus mucilaginosus 3016]WFA20142.1 ABC transporter permease [Paenibacillus mucilaginosus]
MSRYVLQRLLNAIPILIGITIISFAIIHMAPGSPLSAFMEDPTIKTADKENMVRTYGLDQPLYVQYWKWVSGMVTGDFGTSFLKNQPVSDLILDRLPNTLLLTVTSMAISLLIALPLGILCALRVDSRLDRFVSSMTFVGMSVPAFWLGLMLIMFFSVKLGVLPSGGLQTVGGSFSLTDRLQHLVLPLFTIVCGEVAVWTRYVRSSMLEVINQDYMRTGQAKGLRDARVLGVHGLRNALIPLATLFGLSLPGLFAGTLIVETIFSIPGMGRLFTEAAFQRDYPVIFAITTISAFLYVFGSILADISYALLDPRVSYTTKEAKG